MALIKKQIFRPSKDENLQQFFAKEHGENMEMRWGQPSSKDKPNTQARKQGLIRGVKGKKDESLADQKKLFERGQLEDEMRDEARWDRDAERDDKLDQAEMDKKVKSEPKSPWDDESDALDQGSDNSNSADDRTQKEFIIEGVQDAWFEKAGDEITSVKPGSPESATKIGKLRLREVTGDELTSRSGVKPGTPSGRAGRSPSNQAAMKDADSNRRAGQTPYFSESKGRRKDNKISDMSVYHKKKAIERDELRNDNRWNQPSAKPRRDELTSSKSGEPTRTPGKGQTAKFREGKWQSKMQKAVWDAYFEKQESQE